MMKEVSEKGLNSLLVWQKGRQLVKEVYQHVLPRLPVEEKWVLSDQLRRSVQSVPANIAEGYGRFYYQEGIRFSYLARGSLEVTYSHITTAYDLGYIPDDVFSTMVDEIQELRRILSGYIGFLKRTKRGASELGNHSVSEARETYRTDATEFEQSD
jgi:four helix bundle protein